ncbi:SMI1/KNR4 family protein [Paenibacillus sp. J2TS4]|uniref:SMI1/KNR4 family protein n=1 Tax=Paenibacillus sp. J2TS4 TaxID=2807194 RepID=UPI001B2F76C6|nr:SMI1/KNR4 family protein [Paenibacillus sp. J2TS4]GIP36458.1 hypothetical protein J2TS4_56680 [Paenibacillus sp. J2TS4]
MPSIEKTINALKERLTDGKLLIQYEDGLVEEVTCTFNSPALNKDILRLSELTTKKLPQEYLDLLNYSNGFRLFDGKYGGGYHFYSVDEIFDDYNLVTPPDYWIPIGAYCGDIFYLDTSAKKNMYLIFQDPTELFTRATYRFNISLSDWLEKLIIAQGSHFWRWRDLLVDDG